MRIDTHVHFHDSYDEGAFLDAALANLSPQAEGSKRAQAAICLTETSSASWFERLESLEQGAQIGQSNWRIEHTGEGCSIIARDRQDRRLVIIAGRQIVCREGLEVLALGYARRCPDGQPIRSVLAKVSSAEALAVVPWGFGKWLGRRGRVVRELIVDPPCSFLLGDNGGRLSGWPEPNLFAEGRSRGFKILPGSDPFPFKWDQSRVGTFGVECDRNLNPERPFADFKNLLLADDLQPRSFGRMAGVLEFLRNQFAIQMRSVLPR